MTLLLEELQHIQHRGAPQLETQLTIAKALGGCVRRTNKSRPAICDNSFGMERSSKGSAPAKHDRSPCAPQSLETRALMVWRSQAVHFTIQEHDALERRNSAETALEDICETLVLILITTHNDLAGIPDGTDHRHIPRNNIPCNMGDQNVRTDFCVSIWDPIWLKCGLSSWLAQVHVYVHAHVHAHILVHVHV